MYPGPKRGPRDLEHGAGGEQRAMLQHGDEGPKLIEESDTVVVFVGEQVDLAAGGVAEGRRDGGDRRGEVGGREAQRATVRRAG